MTRRPESTIPPRRACRRRARCPSGRVTAVLAIALAAAGISTSAAAVEVTVQLTAFQVPELTLGLGCWDQSMRDDADLYQRLVTLAAQGQAEVVLDHRVTTQSGARLLSEARSEYIYPTEFDPSLGNLLHRPTAFETRNLGTRIEAEATAVAAKAGQPVRAIDCFFSATRVQFKGLFPLEFPNLGAAGPRTATLGTPVFMTEEISTAVSLLRGRPMMIGLTRPADQSDEQPGGATQAVVMTFARALMAGADATGAMGASGHESSPIRMQALTVRLPLLAAAQRVWNHGPASAEALRQALLDLARSGSGKIMAHAGVTTLSGRRAKADSLTELICHTELDPLLLPTAFETRNIGIMWEVEVTRDGVIGELSGTAALEATHSPLWRAIPIGPGSAPPVLEAPDFLSSQWGFPISMTVGETSLVAAVTPPAEGAETDPGSARWLDVSFLKSIAPDPTTPPAIRRAVGAFRRTAVCLVVFSVPEEAAIALKEQKDVSIDDRGDATPAVDALWAAASSGEARLLTLARCLQKGASRSRVEGVREWMFPTEWVAAKGASNALCPTVWETFPAGTELEVEVHPDEDTEAGIITLSFSHEIASPTFPTFDAVQAAQPSGHEDEATSPRPTFYHLSVDGKVRYTAGHPQFLSIEKSPAPQGHPEHGRWLVVVMKVTGDE